IGAPRNYFAGSARSRSRRIRTASVAPSPSGEMIIGTPQFNGQQCLPMKADERAKLGENQWNHRCLPLFTVMLACGISDVAGVGIGTDDWGWRLGIRVGKGRLGTGRPGLRFASSRLRA